ncbi:NADP-dependent oxidoreductase [Gelidibacter mesophilus]|uniref:NADP-dependent oxidoreductase n=1 Tax=Gelidibacter mesophilus TaxID=169050 RepID=UPI000423BF71|nr:NADP-dependent oxidoreductase [Gelidibacter mesophilus]
MSKEQNKEIVLAEHPKGVPTKETFKINDIDLPSPKDGELLLKTIYVSVDPGKRGFMDKGEDNAAGKKFQLDEAITSRSDAQVLESKSDAFKKDDIVHGRLAWKKFQAVPTDGLEKVDPELAPLQTSVSVLGVTGLAAYFGLLKIGKPKKGETVVVSGAAGSVGSTVAQIAKIKGCRVVGIAGSKAKIDYLENELGIDKGINYKKTVNMESAIKEACPDGVDVFFDNVGGDLFDAVFANSNRKSRMVICGQIAEYNDDDQPEGPRPQHLLIKKSAKIEGFVVFDFEDEFDEAKKQLADWYNSGKLKYKENLVEGFENIPSAFIGLFSGENIGKQMVKVSEEE